MPADRAAARGRASASAATRLREAVKVLVAKGMVEVRPKTGMRILPERNWNLLDRDVLAWHAHSERRLTRAFELVEFRLIVEPMARLSRGQARDR